VIHQQLAVTQYGHNRRFIRVPDIK